MKSINQFDVYDNTSMSALIGSSSNNFFFRLKSNEANNARLDFCKFLLTNDLVKHPSRVVAIENRDKESLIHIKASEHKTIGPFQGHQAKATVKHLHSYELTHSSHLCALMINRLIEYEA